MKNQKNKYLAIIMVCLLVISFSVYYTLGGFDPVEVYTMEGAERTVVGQEYVGKHKSPKLDSIRQVILEDLEEGKLSGKLTIVDYQYESRDSVRFFIGASFDKVKEVISIPSSYDFREFSTSKVYKVFITQSFFVRPTPEEVREQIAAQARQDGTQLTSYSFELYYEDGSLSVEHWVED